MFIFKDERICLLNIAKCIAISHNTSDMEAIIDQVQALAAEADEAGRARLLDCLRDLQGRVESPQDTFFRLFNSVRICLAYLMGNRALS